MCVCEWARVCARACMCVCTSPLTRFPPFFLSVRTLPTAVDGCLHPLQHFMLNELIDSAERRQWCIMGFLLHCHHCFFFLPPSHFRPRSHSEGHKKESIGTLHRQLRDRSVGETRPLMRVGADVALLWKQQAKNKKKLKPTKRDFTQKIFRSVYQRRAKGCAGGNNTPALYWWQMAKRKGKMRFVFKVTAGRSRENVFSNYAEKF